MAAMTATLLRLRPALTAGAGAAALTFALMYLTVNAYVAALSVAAGGEPAAGRVESFVSGMVTWGLPALYALLTLCAAAWSARRTRAPALLHGILVGLLSDVCLQLIGLAFGPLIPTELVIYTALGLAAGPAGAVVGRALLSGQEALYRASRAVDEAHTPPVIAAAIGEHLGGAEGREVALWRFEPETESEGASSGAAGGARLLGSWSSGSGETWSATVLDEPEILLATDGSERSWRVLQGKELRPSERKVWQERGIASALLVRLGVRGEGAEGLLVVASRGRRAFSRRKARPYLTAASQAALALENLRLVEQARRAGMSGERRRLASEIHDTLVQGFSGIVMRLEAAEDALGPDSEAARNHLDRARRVARESLSEARRLVWALRPEQLERAPLAEALGRLCEGSSEDGVRAQFSVTGAPFPLAPQAEVTLWRAAQEGLANVRKHARASRAVLTLSYMDDRVALDVRDDGIGFRPGETRDGSDPSSGGYGLEAMRRRAERLGGSLLVESEPGKGTTLSLELPMDTGERAEHEARTTGEVW